MPEAVIQNINDPKIRAKARNLMLKARVFRFFALFFAVIGFGLFMILYLRNIDGQWIAALTEPRTLWMVLLPFLPAALLSYIAERTSEQFFTLVRQDKKTEQKPEQKDNK